jgi:hypothetical protein
MLPGFMQASASKHKCQYPALFQNVKDFCDLKRSESIPWALKQFLLSKCRNENWAVLLAYSSFIFGDNGKFIEQKRQKS